MSENEVAAALVARGLPPDAGLDVLLTHERVSALTGAYNLLHWREQRRASQGTGSWGRAASVLARLIASGG